MYGESGVRQPKNNEREFITTSELAAILGISRVTIHKRIKNGEIEAIKIGKFYAIPKSYLAEVFGRSISEKRKKTIEKAVHKTIKEYGEVLLKLGRE